MKITVSNTTKIVTVNGVPARIWEGTSESGVPVMALVTRISAHGDLMEFDRELEQTTPPSADAQALPSRLIL